MNITIVSSENNPQIKDMASLLTPRGRKRGGTFLAEGFNIVREAVLAGLEVTRIAVQNEVIESDKTRALLKMEQLAGVQFLKVPRVIIKQLCITETPQGIVAEVKRPEAPEAQPPVSGLSIACECIQDPRNLGMLARTAHAAGVSAIYLGPGSVDQFHPHVVGASMGSVFHLNVFQDSDLGTLIRGAKKNGVRVWATASSGGALLPEAARNAAGSPVMLLFGNEGAGLSPVLRLAADELVTIPMPGGAESLNISVAAAVMLFTLVMGKEKE